MIGYKDQYLYHGTHFWWDADDNEYILCATWKCEKGYDIPDSWHLEDLEVEQYNGQYDVLVHDIERGDNIWRDVEKEGPPFAMDEVYYG